MSPNQDVGGVPTFRACNFRFPSSILVSYLSSCFPTPPNRAEIVVERSPQVLFPPRGTQNCFELLTERYDARPSFVEPALYSPPPNFLVSRILAGLSRAGKIGASCVTVADYSFQLRAAPTWPNFHPARAISLLLDWPSPNSPSFEETPQLSSPFSSKAIDRDKEPQTLPCRRCEFLPLVPLRPNSPWSSPIFPALRGLKAPSGGSVASDGIAANKRPGWQFRVSQLSPLLPAASQFTIKMSLSHYLAPRLALKAFDVTFHLPGTATASPKRCVD